MKTFLSCSLCPLLPEGHGILSTADGDFARRDQLQVVYADEREALYACPECGTLYQLQITPIDTGFWATFVDPYDIPTEPHESTARLAPSRGEELLAQHAPARLPGWKEHVERHRALFARAFAQRRVALNEARLRHAVAFQIDCATQEELVALLQHGDLRVVLFTAQALLYPRGTDPRWASSVAARLKKWLPALNEPLSDGLRRCLGSRLGPAALELVGYARAQLNPEVLAVVAERRARDRERLVARLATRVLDKRLTALCDLLMNLDDEFDRQDSSAFGRARPEVAERFADALCAGFADRALRRRAVGIVQQWTIADRHIELFRPVLPKLAELLVDDSVRTFAEDGLIFHFVFYDEPTRQVLRQQLAHREVRTAAAARKVLENWEYRLRSAKRLAEAERLASDLQHPVPKPVPGV